MSLFQVKIYGGPDNILDCRPRQRAANADGAICYFEQHLNSDGLAKYGMAEMAYNGSQTSWEWATRYCEILKTQVGDLITEAHPNQIPRPPKGRGNICLEWTDMPAILGEPLFVSNPDHVAFLRSPNGVIQLATVLAQSIIECFPDGGLVALSTGHRYRGNSDQGAPVIDAQGEESEGFYAEAIIRAAAPILENFLG